MALRAHRTLPGDIPEFTGRTAELRWLWAQLDRFQPAVSPDPLVITVEGMAGTGKTRLAIHFAHQLLGAGRYPDQHLYADLAGYAKGAPADPAAVLASFLQMLGVARERIPGDLADLTALYRRRLCDSRTLVVLDNAASVEQVLPLVPPGPRSLCLVTSRRSLRVPGAQRLPLDVFPHSDAVRVLTAVLGPERADADHPAAARIAEACDRLPLALGLVARRLQARPAWTLGDMAARLADPRQRLAELVAGDRSVRAAFDQSCRTLPADVRRHLRRFGAHPAPDFAVDELGIAPLAARRAVDHLRDEHLVAVTDGNRYRLHGLVRDYLREAC